MTRRLVYVLSAIALFSCAPKKKRKPPAPPVPTVVKPDPLTMDAPTPQLVRDLGRGELAMAAVVDLDKGAYYAYYNGDLGSERRLCGDALRSSVEPMKRLMKRMDQEGYQFRCEGLTCQMIKGAQWRGAVEFRPAAGGGLKLEGVMLFMHPDAGDVFDSRLDAAHAQACGPTVHELLDREKPDYCQTLCARADTCQALKPVKASAAKCVELCDKNKEVYAVPYCDLAGKDCPTLLACVTSHKTQIP